MLNKEHRSGESRETRPMGPGERIGPYRIEGLLGKGGMGEVVVAYDERLDRRVAIKLVRRDGSSDGSMSGRARLRREARAAAGLNHPSIVQIFDILDVGDGDAIVMELVEGHTLAQCLLQGPMAMHQVLRLGRQVAEGLAEAHRTGVVHRELKTENVMVTSPDDNSSTHASAGSASAGSASAGRASALDETRDRDGLPSIQTISKRRPACLRLRRRF